MRSFLLIAGTVLVLGLGLGVYILFQPSTDGRTGSTVPKPAAMRPNTAQLIIQPGENPWFKSFDEKTGELSSQFRAEQYEPQPDGNVRVTHPQAEFFLSGGQVIRVHGNQGLVTMPEAARKQSAEISSAGSGPTGAPNRGQLQQVEIRYFTSLADASANRPALTMLTDNITFDNDTFRIYTDACVINGSKVAPEQVPITIRGTDYDFDGQGLMIRWNERERRLQRLEIARGERLVVKNAQAMSLPVSGARAGGNADPATALVSADPRSVADAIATRPAAGDFYRATLSENVQITQGEQTLATADRLELDFLIASERQQPATSAPATTRRAPTTSATAPIQAPATSATRGADKAPAAPIVIRWSGKLTVDPLGGPPVPSPQTSSDYVLRMQGAPVRLTSGGDFSQCASLSYDSSGGTLRMRRSDRIELILQQADGSVVTADAVELSQKRGRAVIRGNSRARWPIESADGKAQFLTATWQDRCVLMFDDAQKMIPRSANITGKVVVDHPQLHLTAGMLDLSLEPGKGKSPVLREVQAEQDVTCTLRDQQQKQQTIQCNSLHIQTVTNPRGAIYPQRIIAQGEVRVADEQQELRAGYLETTLAAPDTADREARPRLTSLVAHDQVHLTSRDGGSASGDRLTMEGSQEAPVIKLMGQPAKLAGTEATLSGPIIQANPAERFAQVMGAGSMHSQASEATGSRPLEVTWTGGAVLKNDTIDVTGQIAATMTDEDGAVNKATADRLQIVLAERSDGPRPSASAPSATAPDMDFLRNKTVRTVTLQDEAQLTSTLQGAQGLLRRSHLSAAVIRYELADAGARLHIPTGGRMLHEDYQPGLTGKQGVNGATALRWQDHLNFDQGAHKLEIVGGIVVVHEPSSDQSLAYRLEANQITADIQPAPQRPAGENPVVPVQVQSLQASGDVRCAVGPREASRPRRLNFLAESLAYESRTARLIARGTEQQPAQLIDAEGTSGGSFVELWWNIKTEQIDRLTRPQATVRP